MVKICSIDANIGCGKSTLIERIKSLSENCADNREIWTLKEPTNIWEDIKDERGKNILQCFYENQIKYSFTFQIIALHSRKKILREEYEKAKLYEASTGKQVYIITERTVISDYNIFAKMLHEEGKISELEFNCYKFCYNEYKNMFKIDKCIYIDSNPKLCYERCKKRSRQGEENMPLDYLEKIHNQHTSYIDSHLSKHNLLQIDGKLDINSQEYNSQIQKIFNFIYT